MAQMTVCVLNNAKSMETVKENVNLLEGGKKLIFLRNLYS